MGKKESQVKVRIFHGSFSIVVAKTIKRFLTLGCVPYRSLTQKILFSLIFIMSQGISIHAMDNVRIVPFDGEKHFDVTRDLLRNAGVYPDGLTNREVRVLVRRYPATRSKRPDKVLGAVVYETKQFLEITDTWILALAIASQYQRKGHGTILMRHIESIPSDKPHHIYLWSSAQAAPFYKKLGYQGNGFMKKTIKKN